MWLVKVQEVDRRTLDIGTPHTQAFMDVALSRGKTLVLNCAAYTDVDRAEDDFMRAWNTNATGPAHLHESMRRHPDSYLVHFSTDYVFGSGKNLEYDAPDPHTAYGATKLAGELALHNRENISVVRVAWLYGIRNKPTFPQLLAESYKRGTPISVAGDNEGNPTYCGSLARNILQCFLTPNTPRPSLVHYTGPGKYTREELAEDVLKVLGGEHLKLRIIDFAEYLELRRAPVPYSSILESQYTPKMLGMQDTFLLDDLREFFSELYPDPDEYLKETKECTA